jgi:hypothetical protein
VRFSLIDGCYLCENCNGSGPLSLTVSKETIKYFLRLQRAPAKIISSIEKADAENCEALLMSFLQYHIEEAKYLKSLKFLRNLQSNS